MVDSVEIIRFFTEPALSQAKELMRSFTPFRMTPCVRFFAEFTLSEANGLRMTKGRRVQNDKHGISLIATQSPEGRARSGSTRTEVGGGLHLR